MSSSEYWWISIVIILVLGLDLYILWSRTHESFSNSNTSINNDINSTEKSQSLYDLMEKESQISNDVYMKTIRDADVIQSNPWIMIEPVTKNATIHPRGVLDRLTGQQPESLSWHPRSYYDFSDVLYTGLPL